MAKYPFIPLGQIQASVFGHSSRVIRDASLGLDNQRASVLPDDLYFGSVSVGQQSTIQSSIVKNEGSGPLTIKDITHVGDFSVTHDCPDVLAPGAYCTLSAMFTPQRAGFADGGIYVDTGDAKGMEFVRLSGAGIAANTAVASASSSTLAYGQVVLTQSSQKTVTISNIGTVPLTITNIVKSGTDFTLSGQGTLPRTLNAGQSFTMTVTFAPATLGAKTGSITLTHNGSGVTVIALSGTGVDQNTGPATISISNAVIGSFTETPESIVSGSPSSLLIPDTTVGDTSSNVVLTLTNSGSLPASITNISITGPFSLSPASADVGDTIAANGGTAVFQVRFSPTVEGPATGVLTITTNATNGSTITRNLIGEGLAVAPVDLPRLKISGNQFLNVEDDSPVRLRSVNWFGAEGTNYTPHGTWAVRWTDILDQIKAFGFNCIRFAFSGDFTTAGRTPPGTAIDFDKNPEFIGKTSLEILDLILDYCNANGMYAVLDHHRRQAGQGADGSPTGLGYTQADWIASWTVMANRYKDHPAVVGADVHNEPHDLTWDQWATAVEACGNAILAVAPDWLIFAEGVGTNPDSTPYWWGGALKGVATRPIVLNVANKVAYSPHEYGQSVGSQEWLSKDTAVPNYPNNLYAVWDAHWGFIFKDNIAPIWIGEFGGHFGVDGNGALTKPYGTYETQWAQTLAKYLNGDYNGDGTLDLGAGKVGMSFAYWSYNPNSGDTGGLVRDDWSTPQTVKLNILYNGNLISPVT